MVLKRFEVAEKRIEMIQKQLVQSRLGRVPILQDFPFATLKGWALMVCAKKEMNGEKQV